MTKFLDFYHKLLLIVMGVLVGILIVPVTLQIVTRYTTLIPTMLWTEEAARFCLIWIIMLGSVVAVREATHFDIDLYAPPRSAFGRLLSQLIVRFSVLGFGLILLWEGIDYALFGSKQTSEIAEINMALIYAAYPFSAAGWILFTLEALARDIATYKGERCHVAG